MQQEQTIILAAVILSVIIITIIYLSRAWKYRKKMRTLKNDNDSDLSVHVYEPAPADNSERNQYLLKFICRVSIPSKKRKALYVRPEYHRTIQSIVRNISENELSMGAYLENVLFYHFEENKKSIKSLYEEKKTSIFNEDL